MSHLVLDPEEPDFYLGQHWHSLLSGDCISCDRPPGGVELQCHMDCLRDLPSWALLLVLHLPAPRGSVGHNPATKWSPRHYQ